MHYRRTILWQKAMEATREVYRLTPRMPREETYGMRSQITRSAVSIPANVAEGWTRESKKEKAQFMAIAQGSVAETETLLTLCEDFGWFPRDETSTVRGLLDEVSRMLTSMRQKQRGPRPSRSSLLLSHSWMEERLDFAERVLAAPTPVPPDDAAAR